jgi:serine/threonine protein kinase/chemotaxis protein histidine kinase CheA
MDYREVLKTGTVLDRKYRIDRVIGAGGFGITYQAFDLGLAAPVAVKEYYPAQFGMRDSTLSVRPRTDGDRTLFDRLRSSFLREARTLAQFDHPAIVRVISVFETHGTAYMVMRFESGPSLKVWLQGLNRPPRQAELDRLLWPLLDAIEMMHRSDFLHRDIAPDNIIVRVDGTPVLLDFGASRRVVTHMSGTLTGVVKQGYSPQEQYSSDVRSQGPWTDIYSLGATIYLAVTGKVPTEATARMLEDGMMPAMEGAQGGYRPEFLAAIDAAMRLHPRNRPQSVAEWREMLFQGAEPGWYPEGGDGFLDSVSGGIRIPTSSPRSGAGVARSEPRSSPRQSSPRLQFGPRAPSAPRGTSQSAPRSTSALPDFDPDVVSVAPPSGATGSVASQSLGSRAADLALSPRGAAVLGVGALLLGASMLFAFDSDVSARRTPISELTVTPATTPGRVNDQSASGAARIEVERQSEQARQREAARLADVARQQQEEAARRQAEEARQREAARLAEVARQQQEEAARRQAEEARQREAARLAEVARQQQLEEAVRRQAEEAREREVARLAEVARQQQLEEAARRQAEEARQREVARLAEVARQQQQEEAARRQAEEARQGEAARLADVARQQQQEEAARRQAEEARQREAARLAEVARQQQQEEAARRQAEEARQRVASAAAAVESPRAAGGEGLQPSGRPTPSRDVPARQVVLESAAGDGGSLIQKLAMINGHVLAGGTDGRLHLWNPGTNAVAPFAERDGAPITAVSASPDETRIVSGSRQGHIRIWDARSGALLRTIEGQSPVVAVHYRTPTRVVALHASGAWSIVDPEAGQTLMSGGKAGISVVTAAAFSGDGRVIFAGLGQGPSGFVIEGWIPSDGSVTRDAARLVGHTGEILAIALAPHGDVVASASADGTVRLWNAASGKETGRLRATGGSVRDLVFSATGALLAGAGADGAVEIWRVSDGERVANFAGSDRALYAAVLSPDGTSLVSSGEDGIVRQWLLPASLVLPAAPTARVPVAQPAAVALPKPRIQAPVREEKAEPRAQRVKRDPPAERQRERSRPTERRAPSGGGGGGGGTTVRVPAF